MNYRKLWEKHALERNTASSHKWVINFFKIVEVNKVSLFADGGDEAGLEAEDEEDIKKCIWKIFFN